MIVMEERGFRWRRRITMESGRRESGSEMLRGKSGGGYLEEVG